MRTRNAILNFATLIVFTVTTIAVGLFASPWLEHWLNKDRFGAYRVIVDCQGYLALLELGLGGALAPLLARAFAKGDDQALRHTMAAATQAYLRVSLATVVVGGALTFILPWFARGLSVADLVDLRNAWLLGLLGSLALSLVPFRSIVEARQQGHRINLLLTAQALFITGMSLVLARAGWGITGQALAFVLGTWGLALVLTARVVRGRLDLLRSWAIAPDPEARRALWSLSAATFLISVSGRLSLMTDNLVVGSMLGASMVTTLFFTQRLAVLAQSLLLGIGSATWAPLAELHARGETEAFNRRLVELSRLVAILSVVGLGPIVAYNRHFITAWMGPSFAYGGEAVIVIAAINAFLFAQVALWGWCFSATGQTRRLVKTCMASALVNVTASVLLARWLGIVGPLLGTTVGFVGVSLWNLPWLLHQVFGTSTHALIKAVAAPLGWGGLATSGLWWLAHHHEPYGRVGLAAEIALAVLAFAALGSGTILAEPAERALWRGRVRTVFARG
jgi:O-antigen/teichoic acid export membrane protein